MALSGNPKDSGDFIMTWRTGFWRLGQSCIFLWAIASIVSCATLFPQAAIAREPDKVSRQYDLEQLIARAIAESPEMGKAESELLAAQSSLDQVKAAYYPQLDSTAVVGPVQDAKAPVIVGNRIHDPSPGLDFSSIGIFGRLDFTVTQPVYTFGKLSNNKEAAQYGVAAKKIETDKVKDAIAYRVTQLYYALILARSEIDAARDADSFFDEERDRFQRLLNVGSPMVSESDLYMVDAYRAGVLHAQIQAQKGIKFTTYALRAMLNIPAGGQFEVASGSFEMNEKEDLPTLVQQALANRPEFKQLRQALKAREYQTAAAESDLYPSVFLALEGRFAGAPGREHFDNQYIDDDFNHANIGVVAGLNWQWDFGIKKARVSEARAEYQQMLYTRKKAEKYIPVQVAKAYEDIVEWNNSAKIYKNATTASRKWVVTAIADFDMGIGTAENLLRAVEKYGDNQGKYVEALLNYHLAAADLQYATGTIRAKTEK